MKHHLGRRVREGGWEVEHGNAGPGTMDVPHSLGEIGLVVAPVIECYFMTESVKRGDDVGTDKVGSTYDQHPHPAAPTFTTPASP
jgi:hypothetical protein